MVYFYLSVAIIVEVIAASALSTSFQRVYHIDKLFFIKKKN